ncbi:MAG: riboflavin synthase [Epsilonproteobacteria bacterium]|nr:MAG: riboflavin synthase [Campylobacterota bacterium]RLA65721.1 MAG: riboflavin synthase [Campylobacterota bacterium]
MFTGLVKEVGRIKEIRSNPEGKELIIESKELLPEMGIDDSVSVNGACQTVTEVRNGAFKVQSIHVTLEKTTLGSLKPGDPVNLELALRASDRLGGHFVQGHVNDCGVISNIKSIGENYLYSIKYPENLGKYIISEGSIAIDGISLTVARLNREARELTVSLIPHTMKNTNLNSLKVGDKVNLEVDLLAKYIENLLSKGDDLSQKWLASKGF